MRKGPNVVPFLAMNEAIQRILDRVTEARVEIQHQQELAKIGGPVNEDQFRWLAGQNRAFGHVQLWLREELSKEDGKRKGLPGAL